MIGATPLDVSHVNAAPMIREKLNAQGYSRVYCYGMGGSGLDEAEKAGSVGKNIVLSPAGIRAAQYLQETFGTPYETAYPLLKSEQKEQLHGLSGKRVLVVHQQVAANAVREEISGRTASRADAGSAPGKCSESIDENICEHEMPDRGSAAEIVCGTWFMQRPELKEPQDVSFEREDQFVSYVNNGQFDAIVGDQRLKRALRDFRGEYIEIPHFAVSGEYESEI